MSPNENQPFDYRMILAFVLMFAIVMIYTMYVQPPSPQKTDETATTPEQPQDTIAREYETRDRIEQQPPTESLPGDEPDTLFFADSITIDTILVETPLYTARFTTLGADIVSFQLKEYHYIKDTETDEGISLVPEHSPSALRFEFWGQPLQLWRRGFTADRQTVSLTKGDDSSTVRFTWQYDDENTITKTYVFYPDRYAFDVILSVPEDFPLVLEREYTFGWDAGLEPTESRKEDDIGKIAAVAKLGKDIEKVDEIDDDEQRPKRFGGDVVWAGVRTKYFMNIVIPRSVQARTFMADRSFGFIEDDGERFKIPYFTSRFAIPISASKRIDHRYSIYMGPMDYFVVGKYDVGLEGLIDLEGQLGFLGFIRPLAIFVLWSLHKLHSLIPNYGFVIILFSFLFKLVFHPFTKKGLKSMQRMKEMQPRMQKIREKYKDDPQRMQRETMKMYKETGFNPLSGCLPMLIPMPIFFALWPVLLNSIQMRGAEFILHITDLSQMDSLYVLPIIMTLAMFWQQKMTSTDPKQKALIYVLPLVFGFLFRNSPAGLTLYWSMYNIFSVVEQYLIKASKKNEPAAST